MNTEPTPESPAPEIATPRKSWHEIAIEYQREAIALRTERDAYRKGSQANDIARRKAESELAEMRKERDEARREANMFILNLQQCAAALGWTQHHEKGGRTIEFFEGNKFKLPCDIAAEITTLRAQLATALKERDEAIAHDRQPYPTAYAYEKVCEILTTRTAERDIAIAISAAKDARIAELERERDERRGVWQFGLSVVDFVTSKRDVHDKEPMLETLRRWKAERETFRASLAKVTAERDELKHYANQRECPSCGGLIYMPEHDLVEATGQAYDKVLAQRDALALRVEALETLLREAGKAISVSDADPGL